MLICANPRFLFVHIQKTGGTSLASALRSTNSDVQTFQGTHDHARWAQQRLQNHYDSYFKFAFVRNPWDRLVSWYAMIMQASRKQPAAEVNRFWQYVLAEAPTFDDFVSRCTDIVDDVDGQKSITYNQLDYVTDERGQVIVDYVGRYETLEADARAILARLGRADTPLPHENRSSHRDYRSYYSERTRRLVAERYARDIEHFGYQF